MSQRYEDSLDNLNIKTDLEMLPHRGQLPKLGELPEGHYCVYWRKHTDEYCEGIETKSRDTIKKAVSLWNKTIKKLDKTLVS